MRTKPLALALAVAMLLTVGVGGIVAATDAGPAGEQPTTQPTDPDDQPSDTRLTAEESFTREVDEENITMAEEPTRLTADESFEIDIPEDTIESIKKGLYIVDLNNE